VLGLESWLNTQWYGKSKPNLILRAIERLYVFLLGLQKPFSTEKSTVPIIVVGNFTVGGTGKTPLIIALVNALKDLGYQPGVVSRGYGRKSRQPESVTTASAIDACGDEPFLIAKRTGAPVRVDAKRFCAANFLIEHGCNIIISDDGLQHRALPRHIEIEVVDAKRLYGNGRLLPAGPLREPVRRVDLRVGNGLHQDTPNAFAMQLHVAQCYHLLSGERKALQDFTGETVHAVAGIGHPARFFDALTALGIAVIPHPFPDHHSFNSADLPVSGTILMTEKDAVKCSASNRQDIWVVPVDALLSEAFLIELKRLIAQVQKRL
jgi:tetraacyldisaccharide 4'-kinase